MKVKELIKKLSTFDAELKIYSYDYDRDFGHVVSMDIEFGEYSKETIIAKMISDGLAPSVSRVLDGLPEGKFLFLDLKFGL